MMPQQGVLLKGLLAGDVMHAIAADDERERAQDLMAGSHASSSAVAALQRKKASRSPLRARQQQSSSIVFDLDNTQSMKSRSGSPDANDSLMNMMMKKKEEGAATLRSGTPHSYSTPTFMSKPTTPRDWMSTHAGAPDHMRPPRPHADLEWEKIVAIGKKTNDGTHLIRLLADFIEEFQFSSNHGKGEYASWVQDPKSLPVENRHSHHLAGQLRKLADVFESENCCSLLKEKRLK